jgi:folate-dependent phosphoribosylglycinamide formyltransferase PurN
MKIVLLTSDYNLSANIGIKTFLENPKLKKHGIEIAGLVSANPYHVDRNSWRRMRRFMKQCGWSFSLKNIITNMWKHATIKFAKWFIPDKNREYFDIDELAHHHNIPFLEVENINSKESEKFIKKMKPDYLVSCFLLQILKKEILNLSKKGAINVHPALMQQHRGTFSAFWAMIKNWKSHGATVHFMTEKLDRGLAIIQRKIFVHPSDTMYCVNKKSAKLGAYLLVKALIKLKRNEARGFLLKKFGQMFTAPKSEDIQRFYAQGKSLIKARDFFKA